MLIKTLNRRWMGFSARLDLFRTGGCRLEWVLDATDGKPVDVLDQLRGCLKRDVDTMAVLRYYNNKHGAKGMWEAWGVMEGQVGVGAVSRSAVLMRLLDAGMGDEAEKLIDDVGTSRKPLSADAVSRYLSSLPSYASRVAASAKLSHLKLTPRDHAIIAQAADPHTAFTYIEENTPKYIDTDDIYDELVTHAETEEFLRGILARTSADRKRKAGFVVKGMEVALKVRSKECAEELYEGYSGKSRLPLVLLAAIDPGDARKLRGKIEESHKGGPDEAANTFSYLLSLIKDRSGDGERVYPIEGLLTVGRWVAPRLSNPKLGLEVLSHEDQSTDDASTDALISRLHEATDTNLRKNAITSLFPIIDTLTMRQCTEVLQILLGTPGLARFKGALLRQAEKYLSEERSEGLLEAVVRHLDTLGGEPHLTTKKAVFKRFKQVHSDPDEVVFKSVCGIMKQVRSMAPDDCAGLVDIVETRRVKDAMFKVAMSSDGNLREVLTVLDGCVQHVGAAGRYGAAGRLLADIYSSVRGEANLSEPSLELLIRLGKTYNYDRTPIFKIACKALVYRRAPNTRILSYLCEYPPLPDVPGNVVKPLFTSLHGFPEALPYVTYLLSTIGRSKDVKIDIDGVVKGIEKNLLSYRLKDLTLLLLAAKGLPELRRGKFLEAVESFSVELLERTMISPLAVSCYLSAYVSAKHVPSKAVIDACIVQLLDNDGSHVDTDPRAAYGLLSAFADLAKRQPGLLSTSLPDAIYQFLGMEKEDRVYAADSPPTAADIAILLISLWKMPDTPGRNTAITGVVCSINDLTTPSHNIPRDGFWGVYGVLWGLTRLQRSGDIKISPTMLAGFVGRAAKALGLEDTVRVLEVVSPLTIPVVENAFHDAATRWGSNIITPDTTVRITRLLYKARVTKPPPGLKRFLRRVYDTFNKAPGRFTPKEYAEVLHMGVTCGAVVPGEATVKWVEANLRLYTTEECYKILWAVSVAHRQDAASLYKSITRMHPPVTPDEITSFYVSAVFTNTWLPSPSALPSESHPIHRRAVAWALSKSPKGLVIPENPSEWHLESVSPGSKELGFALFGEEGGEEACEGPPDTTEKHLMMYL